MARIEFDYLKEAEDWIREFVIKANKGYVGYITNAHELILVQTKSTSPIIYGYVRHVNKKDVRALFRGTSIKIFNIDKFEWNAERGLPARG